MHNKKGKTNYAVASGWVEPSGPLQQDHDPDVLEKAALPEAAPEHPVEQPP